VIITSRQVIRKAVLISRLEVRLPLLKIGDLKLEYDWHGPGPDEKPTLVFLHEGLGCVAMWRDFPERVARATGLGAFVYSRAGYGNSSRVELPRSVGFMHDEALTTLPRVLEAMKIRNAILVGHSDGGSIALIGAGGLHPSSGENTKALENADVANLNLHPSRTVVHALVLEAPHVFVEEFGLESIRKIADDYVAKGLRSRLARYHGDNVDETFWGWNNVWLDPEFRSWNIEEYLNRIHVPVLLIQGEDDQYGTGAHINAIQRSCKSVRTLMLKDCGHSPHLDQADRTLEAIQAFVKELDFAP
jgi:pimeloyl-ACP methyl ester carboxylesterase